MRGLVIKDANLRLWQAFILLFPFYFLPSGLPRISDFALMAIAFRLAARGKVQMVPGAKIILRVLLCFVAYVFFVNAVNGLWNMNLTCFQSASFYIYNMLAVALVFVLYSEYQGRFLSATFSAMAITLAIQVLFGFRDVGNPARATIFFNNPNQLGYFSLIAAAIVAYCSAALKAKQSTTTVLFLICVFLALISLSKAAMVGVLMMLVLYGATRPKMLALFGAIALVILVFFPGQLSVVDRASARLSSIGGQYDDSLGGRGYTRIVEFPQFLAFGSGEGAFERFNKSGGQELHSIFGTLLFAYGICGCALIGTFIYLCVRGQGFSAYPLIPIASYGFTHQGLRFTLLWCLLALSWCVTHYIKHQKELPPNSEPEPVPLPAPLPA